MPGKHYTNEQKKKAAQMAITHKANGGQYSEVADIVGCHMTMIGKWVDAYRLGKYDVKPEKSAIKTESTLAEQIDTRPAILKIAAAIDDLTQILEQVCIRLDSIFQKNTEDHANFDAIMTKVLNKAPVKGDEA